MYYQKRNTSSAASDKKVLPNLSTPLPAEDKSSQVTEVPKRSIVLPAEDRATNSKQRKCPNTAFSLQKEKIPSDLVLSSVDW